MAHEDGGGGVLRIPIIRAQLGDSLRQLFDAVLFAETHNYRTVCLSWQTQRKHFDGFLAIPADSRLKCERENVCRGCHPMRLPSLPQSATRARCQRDLVSFVPARDLRTKQLSFICSGATPRDWARFGQHIWPLLTARARTDRRDSGAADELIVHVRGGDALTQAHQMGNQPPCAFYDHAIESGLDGGPFQHVRVITGGGTPNPCVAAAVARHPRLNVTVQRGTREEDAAALLNARHLVLASSYFSVARSRHSNTHDIAHRGATVRASCQVLGRLNRRLRSVFYLEAAGALTPQLFPLPGCADDRSAGTARLRTSVLRAPGIDHRASNFTSRSQWMLAYPREHLLSCVSDCARVERCAPL